VGGAGGFAGRTSLAASNTDDIGTRLLGGSLPLAIAARREHGFGERSFRHLDRRPEDARTLAEGRAINHDRDLRLQYLAGLALNHAEEDTIYREMLVYGVRPSSLFQGSPSQLTALYSAMEAGHGGRSRPPRHRLGQTSHASSD
jgi:spermidine synthase